jgi:hypothetical protein
VRSDAGFLVEARGHYTVDGAWRHSVLMGTLVLWRLVMCSSRLLLTLHQLLSHICRTVYGALLGGITVLIWDRREIRGRRHGGWPLCWMCGSLGKIGSLTLLTLLRGVLSLMYNRVGVSGR